MRYVIAFVVGGMLAASAAAIYFVPDAEQRVRAIEEQLATERANRSRAERSAAESATDALRARVELDQVRRKFFDLRHNWFIPPAANDCENIKPPGVFVPERQPILE